MGVQIRLECDSQACGSWTMGTVQFDECSGKTQSIDGEAQGVVTFEGCAATVPGWVVGEGSWPRGAVVFCAVHGEVCSTCEGSRFVGRSPCPRCSAVGVVEIAPRAVSCAA